MRPFSRKISRQYSNGRAFWKDIQILGLHAEEFLNSSGQKLNSWNLRLGPTAKKNSYVSIALV